jgi:membrane dipeptidase
MPARLRIFSAPALSLALVACAGDASGTDAPAAVAVPEVEADTDPLARARALHHAAPLIDGHNDLPWALRQLAPGKELATVDLAIRQPRLMTDLPRLREGGVGAQFWSAYVPVRSQGAEAVQATLDQIDLIYRMIEQHADTLALALTADDLERIAREGRIASLIAIEGGHSLADSLVTLRTLQRLGVRAIGLTHSTNVSWADSATDRPRTRGLSPLGESIVREMNRLGILVDLSHASDATMAAAIRVSEAPVIFSHSSARAVFDHPRNVPDDILRLLPEHGGIVMVTFVPEFLARGRRATLADVADHLDHVRRVAGPDHVGIGSDFDGIFDVPDGLEDVSRFPALTAELLRRGWPEEDVLKALGRNLLRVMREAEAVAGGSVSRAVPVPGRSGS